MTGPQREMIELMQAISADCRRAHNEDGIPQALAAMLADVAQAVAVLAVVTWGADA